MMLRPYIAVVKDSFRAAVANRVLYVMVALVTLLLLALFPINVQEKLNSRIDQNDIDNVVPLSVRIIEGGKSDEPSPEKQVWDRIPKDAQNRMLELYDEDTVTARDLASDQSMGRFNKQARSMNELVFALNECLNDRDFYDEDAWSDYSLDQEAKDFLDAGIGRLTSEELARFNRLLINTAFGSDIFPGPPTSIQLRYFRGNMFGLPIRKQQLPQYMNIPWILDKFVLSIGVFVAILVTASVIPQTLEPGSLNLLLSKPVQRWALFLSKYFGACAFTVLLSVYLFVGLWFFFGTRIGVWDSAFLSCIPLYVLVFAIYYSVSALAGVVFRSTIIAVVISILFWMLCFLVGTLYSFFYGIFHNYEIDQIVVAGDDVLQYDVLNVPSVWNPDTRKWEQTFIADSNEEMAAGIHIFGGSGEFELPEPFGPVYDHQNRRLISAQGPMMFGAPMLSSEHRIGLGTRENGWAYNESFPLPPYSVDLFLEKDNSVIAVTRLGSIYRLRGDPQELVEEFATKMEQAALLEGSDGEGDAPQVDVEFDFDVFELVGPDPVLKWEQPSAVTQNPVTGEILVYANSNLEIVELGDDGLYRRGQKSSLTLPEPYGLTAQIAFVDNTIIVARGNGEIFRIDRSKMEVLEKFEPESKSAVRSLVASPDGDAFAVLFNNGNLWHYAEGQNDGRLRKPRLKGQGKISAVTFDESGSLWAADRISRVSRYETHELNREETLTPKEGWGGFLYRYVLVPVYMICPKPGEFYRLVTHLSADNAVDETSERDRARRRNPWEPLWNGIVFITVMLLLGCLYFERQDF